MITLKNKVITKPMLAYNGELDLDKDIRYPIYASVKYDGMRLFRTGGKWRTRNDKDSVNPLVLRELDTMEFEDGVDGELVVQGKTFHEGQSILRGSSLLASPPIIFLHFDNIRGQTYQTRFVEKEHIPLHNYSERIAYHKVTQYLCQDKSDILGHMKFFDAEEGLILRSPHGLYKADGRSTLREQYLLKLFRWEEDTAKITGFNELMSNSKPGTKRKKNLTGKGILGSFLVYSPTWGYFNLSGNLTEDQRYEYYLKPELMDKMVRFKYKPYGTKDKPRHPIFLGFV